MALHNAARDGNLQELERLVAAGQDLNARDKHHRTALVMASWAGKVDCVKALLEARADVKVFAMDDMNAMHFAAQKGHAEVVRLLLNHGISVNSKTRKGTNALQFAAKQGHLKVVELLMKRHANVRAADRNGKTALDLTKDDTIREALQTGLQEQEKRQGVDKQAQKAMQAKDAEGEPAPAADTDNGTGQHHTGTAMQDAPGPALEQPQPAGGSTAGDSAAGDDASAGLLPTVGPPSGHGTQPEGATSLKRNVRKRVEEAEGEEPPDSNQPVKRAQKVALSYLDEEDEEG